METGLYYCRGRYYDPAIRRFISVDDTQVLRDNLDMLGEKNLYAYCDDNPIMRVDGDGLIIPGLSEPPVRTLRATIPGNESQFKFLILDD